MTKDGNTEAEIKTRINKARGAFAALKNIWKTKMISKKTKIRIFKSNVLSVLLYVLSHVKTNNKSPTKYFELDSASCRAAKELSVDTNRASLRQLLAAQRHFP